MRCNRIWTRALICAGLILALSGCASSPRPMAVPADPPPAALTVPCPELPQPGRMLDQTLREYLQMRRLYRLCAARQAALSAATNPPPTEDQAP